NLVQMSARFGGATAEIEVLGRRGGSNSKSVNRPAPEVLEAELGMGRRIDGRKEQDVGRALESRLSTPRFRRFSSTWRASSAAEWAGSQLPWGPRRAPTLVTRTRWSAQ